MPALWRWHPPLHCAPMQRIVILVSGRGSNMTAVVRACQAQAWPAVVSAVISNRPSAAALPAAQALGIATQVVDHTAHPDRAGFDAALAQAIDAHAPHWVLLAGFMRILTDDFVQRYEGRMVNVHPSLLPAFPGLHTHRRAIEAGCKVAGATVHFVTPQLDHGPVIAQAVVPVLQSDTEASLAERVLAREHLMLPQVMQWLVRGELQREGARVLHRHGASQLF